MALKRDEQKWQLVSGKVHRLRIPGGWLYQDRTHANPANPVPIPMTFVPIVHADEDRHYWEPASFTEATC